ncbi:chemotaxis-specific protein-glutamate methyltransferase CheB [Vibrio sp. V27_P1S3P104]|uniref:protein-glutamate methylesterase/protein-glutamine glutaminase n=1 Tax=Vibrio TaxID=662 RepID=UPI000C170B9C|nr:MULTISPECIES: chemotaxis response regulator protein-glutamate methylesterase [Vibrio]NAW69936.1 chemotaxis-specific protein-glutamate methyltransferase CheB [Vibrio sp. V28_P6S34P95]NAX04665.1 chemotaxis-specific protein-glutamate methyltransferase CheB [Vibrio sp. V30_P3S12P165]NAX33089.1 chemotaxis-specific protein-glutamate methyltransferase CheB [Vibrio sp. V29_P1S30P107]NAX37454.1 chemotaxis-specific protein-glutamate methyltransferase CheB [Vibrio sp. V27_P1S3P104]NAX41435.1 chemotaxi
MTHKKIKVLIVDDSAVVRQVFSQMLSGQPDIELLPAAADPIFAMKRMQQTWPDVMILDVEMPRMDGITFLKKLMAERPIPVIICSTLTEQGAQITLDALQAGAVTIITKPKVGLKGFLEESTNQVLQAVRSAAKAQLKNLLTPRQTQLARPSSTVTKNGPTPSINALLSSEKIVVIGTSTGGTQALEYVLTRLPAHSPGIVIVQHMPEKFTAMFAERLNNLCQISVSEAKTGDRVLPGCALIAPGGKHTKLVRSGAQYKVEVFDGPPVNRHKPSVDVLFRSTAQQAGKNALAIIMTGMGDDGARGLKVLLDSGAKTVAQDEATCVVFGMPKEAIALGAAQHVSPLAGIITHILQFEADSR